MVFFFLSRRHFETTAAPHISGSGSWPLIQTFALMLHQVSGDERVLFWLSFFFVSGCPSLCVFPLFCVVSVWGIGNQFETAHSVSSAGPQWQEGGEKGLVKGNCWVFLNLIRLPAHSLWYNRPNRVISFSFTHLLDVTEGMSCARLSALLLPVAVGSSARLSAFD